MLGFITSHYGLPMSLEQGTPHKNKRQREKMAHYENDVKFHDTFINFTDIFINMFEWEGMPETCNPRALEQTLYFYGKALFFKDKRYGGMFLHTPVNLQGGQNIYYEFKSYQAYSYNYSEYYTDKNAVLIRATPAMYPFYMTTSNYASKIADASRTIDVYQATLKRPFIIRTNDDTKLEVKIVMDAVHNNEYMVVVDKDKFAGTEIDTQPTADVGGAQILLSLWQHKQFLIDEFLTRIGINSANTEKRERLITDEVNSNNQIKLVNIGYMLQERKKACDAINAMFGLNISVHLRENYDLMELLTAASEQEDSKEDGETEVNQDG